jgi:hypothetical protein
MAKNSGMLGQSSSPSSYGSSRLRIITAILVLFAFISIVYHASTSNDFFQRAPTLPAFNAHFQNVFRCHPGQIRRCKAPRSNSWSGLREWETAAVLDIVEKRKSSVGLGPDDIVYDYHIYKTPQSLLTEIACSWID